MVVYTHDESVTSSAAGICSPNPCDEGASCAPIEGTAFCRCPNSNEFFPLGSKNCSESSSPATESTTSCTDATTNESICGSGIKCQMIQNVPYCECPNGELFEYGTGCSATAAVAGGYSVASQLLDELCTPNPCSEDATCFILDETAHCSCPDTSRSAPVGEPCPEIVAPSEWLEVIHYVGIAVVGMIILLGLLLLKIRRAPTKSKDDLEKKQRESIYEGKDDFEASVGLANLQMEQEYQQLVNTHEDTKAVWKARILVLLAAALCGTTFGMVKEIVSIVPVGIGLMIRFLFPALLTLPRLLCPKKGDTGDGDDDSPRGGCGAVCRGLETGLWWGLAFICQALSLQSVPSAVMGFICGTAVIIVPFFDLFLWKPVKRSQWYAALVALGGVGILTIVYERQSLEPPNMADIWIGLASPFAFSAAIWRMGHAREVYPDHSGILTTAQMQGIFLTCIAYYLCFEDPTDLTSYPWGEWLTDGVLWFFLLWTGLVTTLAPNAFLNYALGALSSTQTALLHSTEAIFAAAFAVIFFGETLGWELFVGGFLVLVGCIISAVSKS